MYTDNSSSGLLALVNTLPLPVHVHFLLWYCVLPLPIHVYFLFRYMCTSSSGTCVLPLPVLVYFLFRYMCTSSSGTCVLPLPVHVYFLFWYMCTSSSSTCVFPLPVHMYFLFRLTCAENTMCLKNFHRMLGITYRKTIRGASFQPDEWSYLLTVRAATVRWHPGRVCYCFD